MQNLNISEATDYVEENIGKFHQQRIRGIEKLQLIKVLKSKNPYLFKAKNVLTADEIIKGLVDAHISSNEETIFGDWLEEFAIFINEKVYGGQKSGISGIDLEFNNDNTRYIVAIKSGPNWGNSSQIKKMKTDFKTAKKTLRTSNSRLHVIAVNGCCYGKNNAPDKGDYFKYCGQQFWEFISGDSELYTKIIMSLGYKAKEKNDAFSESYAKMVNTFTYEFTSDFCKPNGEIDWDTLVRLNSAK